MYAQSTILILGDSLSAAYRMEQNENWVSLLENKLKECNAEYKVVNISASGDTTRSGLQKLPLALEQNNSAVVIIELGGNDGLRGIPVMQIRNNMRKMVDLSLKANAQVLLLGMKLPPNYGRAYYEPFHQIYLDTAKDYKIALVPFLLEGIALNKDYMQEDQVHPNAKAQILIFNLVWPKLQPLLSNVKC